MNGYTMIYALVALILASISIGPAHSTESAFLHDFHVKQQKISCKRCHGFTKYTKAKELVQKNLCHSCHVDKTPELKPLSCTKCHDKKNQAVHTSKPAFHGMLGFSKKHGLFASKSPESCVKCHKKSDCSDCHNRGRAMKSSPHASFFLLNHAQEARMGVMNCSSCHSKSTCNDCHKRSK